MPCRKEDVLVVAVARLLVAGSWVHPTPRLKRHAVKTYGFQTACVRLGKKIEVIHVVREEREHSATYRRSRTKT